MPDYSLAHLTVLGLTPPEVLRVAARTGYHHVGLRLLSAVAGTVAYPLMDDPALLRATRAAMADTGVSVHDIELVRLTPESDVAALEPFVAAGAELGARCVLTAPYDPDLGRLADRLGALTDLCARHGLRPVLEFFPWTDVPDLATAARVVAGCGRAGAGILVDTLHFSRSRSTLAQLRAVDASRLPMVHVADAKVQARYTTEELLHAARAERLPPGEGGINIKDILALMPAGIPFALEVPMTALTEKIGPEAVALRVRQAATKLLG
jgi:sugar phosphate isomerase/epimerase